MGWLSDLLASLSAVGAVTCVVVSVLVQTRARHKPVPLPQTDFAALSAQLDPEEREWLRAMGAEWVVDPVLPLSTAHRQFTVTDLRRMSLQQYEVWRPALLKAIAEMQQGKTLR